MATPLAADWTQFRGGPEQNGIASGTLPAELEPVWTFEIPDGTESTPAIADGKVYIGGLGGKVYALDLESGEPVWTYDTGGEEIKSSPLVYDGTVYFGDEYGRFHAVDQETGEGRWKIEVASSISSSANVDDGGEKPCILFGSYDAFIYCVSPKDGAVVWQVETEGYVHGTPAMSDGRVVSSGCDGHLRVVDAASGEELKALPVGSYVAASPAVRGGVSYFGTFDNNVLAVDLVKGEVVWRYADPAREFPFYASAAVTDELVVVGGRDKTVHALKRKTGEVAWTHAARARIDASPVVVGDRVYVADKAGVVFALALEDGAVVWQYETGSSFAGSPAVAEGRLVIGDEDGVVTCFAGKSSKGEQP